MYRAMLLSVVFCACGEPAVPPVIVLEPPVLQAIAPDAGHDAGVDVTRTSTDSTSTDATQGQDAVRSDQVSIDSAHLPHWSATITLKLIGASNQKLYKTVEYGQFRFSWCTAKQSSIQFSVACGSGTDITNPDRSVSFTFTTGHPVVIGPNYKFGSFLYNPSTGDETPVCNDSAVPVYQITLLDKAEKPSITPISGNYGFVCTYPTKANYVEFRFTTNTDKQHVAYAGHVQLTGKAVTPEPGQAGNWYVIVDLAIDDLIGVTQL
jgi:hypothetical protein